MKDYTQFNSMPVALFIARVVSKLRYMHLGDWIAPCTCNTGGKSRAGRKQISFSQQQLWWC